MLKELYSKNAPEPVGPYSQAVKLNKLVFVSGQIPINPNSGLLLIDTIESQVSLIFNNIGAILKEADMTLENILKVEIFLKDISVFSKVNLIYDKIFTFPVKPARIVVEVSKLPQNVDIEIACIAGITP